MRANAFKPPARQSNIMVTHKFRFVCASSATLEVTPNALLSAAGLVATAATVAYPIGMSMKIRRVSVWSPPPSQGTSAYAAIQWYGHNAGIPTSQISDTTMSVSQPAYVTSKPPQGTRAYQWLTEDSSYVFQVKVETGSVVDVDLSFYLSDVVGSGLARTTSGMTIGQNYYAGLTGVGSSAAPVGLNPAT